MRHFSGMALRTDWRLAAAVCSQDVRAILHAVVVGVSVAEVDVLRG